MMEVLVDGILYVPKASIEPITDEKLKRALELLTEIQYFRECSHKHLAWAWDAMNALAPELAKLSANDPRTAFELVRSL